MIITITHEYASGGREIASKLGELLGYSVFADDIADMTAKKSGLSADYIRENAERKTQSLLYNLYLNSIPMGDNIFLTQSEVVREIAENNDNAIIVGACADYVLKDRADLFRVFVHAPFEVKLAKVEKDGHDKHFLMQTIKRRVSYYNYFTSQRWGEASFYDLSVNSAALGADKTAELIVSAVELARNQKLPYAP